MVVVTIIHPPLLFSSLLFLLFSHHEPRLVLFDVAAEAEAGHALAVQPHVPPHRHAVLSWV